MEYDLFVNRPVRTNHNSIGFPVYCSGCTLPLGDKEYGRQLRIRTSYKSHNNDVCFDMMKDIYQHAITTTDANDKGSIS